MSARLRWSVAIALASHLAAYAWMVQRPGATERSGPAPVPTGEISFDLETEPPRTPAADRPSAAPGATDDHVEERLAPIDALHRAVAALPPEPSGEASVSPPTSSSSGTEWTFSPTTHAALPTGGAFAGRSLDAALRAGVRATLDQEDADGLASPRTFVPPFGPRDIGLGLAPGGALVGIARDLVRRSLVPDVSRAVLRFDTDAAGVVTSACVLDVSSARRDWEEVTAQIAAAARSRPPLKIPQGWRGLSVTLEVISEMRTASGARMTGGVLQKALGALNDPIGTATKTPVQRVVTARMVDVTPF